MMRTSRQNEIIYQVNCRVPKEEIGLKNEEEEKFYNSLIKQAEEVKSKWGEYPVFEMGEIESDDPKLDIYRTDADGKKKPDEIEEV